VRCQDWLGCSFGRRLGLGHSCKSAAGDWIRWWGWLMRTRLVLVHSPLVGCGIWEPVARLLAAEGYSVAVPDLAGAVQAGPPFHRAMARVIAESAASQDVVLVGYSRAGPLLATAGMMPGARVRGYVFVDARLPSPGHSWMQTVAPDLAARLRETADPQGRLPPWPRWQADEELAALVPDPAVRQQFAAGCPRLPLAMLEEVAPPAPRWPDAACGYLQLSAAYQDEAGRARELGWPVRHHPGSHLALLTQPGQVAREIRDLTGQL
jgi:pimeloyl-ACP methyl ester carboxylesterase